jgi:KaiC/GvpD/RAD55 family RecA-like ATPase
MTEGGFPRGSLIVLAGRPGVGKSAFSAQFLANGAASGEPGVYASFAESRQQWLPNFSRHLGVDLERFETKGQLRFMDLLTAVKEPGVSEMLQAILTAVEDLKAKRLVIDSFTALAQALEKPIDVRSMIHTILGKIVRNMGCTTIMVDEIPYGDSTIGLGLEEFVADGVLVLRRTWQDKRLLRVLEIVKMRGTKCGSQRSVFTLENGFKLFVPARTEPVPKPERFQPIPDPPGSFSSGIPDLDELLGGGYPKGVTVMLEATQKLRSQEHQLFYLPTIANFMVQGRGAVVLPGPGVDAELLRRRILEYGLTEDEVNRLLRVLQLRVTVDGEPKPYVSVLPGKDAEKEYAEVLSVYDKLVKDTGHPALSVVAMDTMSDIFGSDASEYALSVDATRMRNRGALEIVVSKPGIKALVEKVSATSDVHLKLAREYGVTLLSGIKPMTNLYGAEFDASKGYLLPKLTQVI